MKNTLAFVMEVVEARGLNVETFCCRVVIDGGQGSLKICLSIFDFNTSPAVASSSQDGPGEKLTGVNRLLLLAEVDGGLESHHNIMLPATMSLCWTGSAGGWQWCASRLEKPYTTNSSSARLVTSATSTTPSMARLSARLW